MIFIGTIDFLSEVGAKENRRFFFIAEGEQGRKRSEVALR